MCTILKSFSAGYTSTQILEELSSSYEVQPGKLAVNQVLYAMKEKGGTTCTNDAPPIWQLPHSKEEEEVSNVAATAPRVLTHCIVDLGNTHDCLQNLLPYAARGVMTVGAYADMAFRGYGISPSVSVENVMVYQADTPDKNSADVQIVWDICRLVDKLEREFPLSRCNIYIATKDMGFMRVKNLVERNKVHTVTFVTNWQALRMHIE